MVAISVAWTACASVKFQRMSCVGPGAYQRMSSKTSLLNETGTGMYVPLTTSTDLAIASPSPLKSQSESAAVPAAYHTALNPNPTSRHGSSVLLLACHGGRSASGTVRPFADLCPHLRGQASGNGSNTSDG